MSKKIQIFIITWIMFDRNQLKALQKLARIRLSEEEEEALLTSLTSILAYVEQLNEIDTEGVDPCSHVIENVSAPLREDEPERLIPRADFLKNAPDNVGGMIKVPSVIKDEL